MMHFHETVFSFTFCIIMILKYYQLTIEKSSIEAGLALSSTLSTLIFIWAPLVGNQRP